MSKIEKDEGGITQISTENIRLLAAAHGPVRFIYHVAPEGEAMSDYTIIAFRSGKHHKATGFSSGYWGEGPRGLCEAIREHLHRADITSEHIAGWRGNGYFILPREGCGSAIYSFPNTTRQQIDRIEVW